MGFNQQPAKVKVVDRTGFVHILLFSDGQFVGCENLFHEEENKRERNQMIRDFLNHMVSSDTPYGDYRGYSWRLLWQQLV